MRNTRYFRNLPASFVMPETQVEQRLLREYGAIFAAKGVRVPDRVAFQDEEDVRQFQNSVEQKTAVIGGFELTLQTAAMDALEHAVETARLMGLSISPRGADSAARSYADTVELWATRVQPGMKHWVANGRITQIQADRILALTPYEQVAEIFALEEDGIFFAKDLSKLIMYSVAPPGTSQHLAMLAFDVREFDEPAIRKILAQHYWYQTVISDLPHFTFLGMAESELESVGLKKVLHLDRTFWIPDI